MKLIVVILILNFLVFCSLGQEENSVPDVRLDQLEEKYKKLKDSLSNTYVFVPAVSSVMLSKNQFEINIISSMVSANK